MKDLLKECAEYFRNPGFSRIMEKIKGKYESLGYLGGTIVLSSLKPDERDALSGLMKKAISGKSVTVKISDMIQSLKGTKFEEVSFEEVLLEYFGMAIISNKEVKNQYEQEKRLFFQELIQQFTGTRSALWLQSVLLKKNYGYAMISKRYDSAKEKLLTDLTYACQAFNALSFDGSVVRLAIFANEITKNPHGFDNNTPCGMLLTYALCFYLNQEYPDNAEALGELFYQAGLIKDEVSNFTLTSGLIGYRNQNIHEGWQGFYDSGEPLQLTLWNISQVDKIVSGHNKVYIFENPTVFSEVLFKTKDLKPSLVCTFGNTKLSTLVLLDQLVANGSVLYYSGDFDPEGLLMADKLKIRYGDKLKLWRFEIADYQYGISKLRLSESRIQKFAKLKDLKLQQLSVVIKQNQHAAYQESLINLYLHDITEDVDD